MLFVGFVWLIWVPFVTCWTWKLFLNPEFLRLRREHYRPPVNQTAIAVGLLQYWVRLPQNQIAFLEKIELSADWNYYIRSFFSDTFEGQIIMAVLILTGLALVFLRDYVVMNARANIEAAALDALQPNPNIDLAQNLVQPLQNIRPNRAMQRQRQGIVRERVPAIPETANLDIQPNRLNTATEELPEEIPETASSEEERRSSPDYKEPIKDGDGNFQYKMLPDDLSNVVAGPSSSNPSGKSNDNGTISEITTKDLQDDKNATTNDKGKTAVGNEGASYDELLSLYNVNVSSKDLIGFTKDESNIQADDMGVYQDPFSNVASSSKAVGNEIPFEDAALKPDDESVQNSPRVEPRQEHETERLLEVVEEIDSEEDDGWEDIIDGIPPQQQIPDLPVENQPEPLNINFNVGFENGAIEAEINANGDVNQFLELIGIAGPFSSFLRNVMFAHIILSGALAVTVLIPHIIGQAVFHFITSYYVPFFENLIAQCTTILQRITDPIIEPLIDGILFCANFCLQIVGLSLNMDSTTSAPLQTVGDHTIWSDIIHTFFGNNATLNNSILSGNLSTLYGGPYHPEFFTTIGDHLLWTAVGWLSIFVMSVIWLAQTGYLDHPYIVTLLGILWTIAERALSTIKFCFFIILEMAGFPTVCGILIDLVTMPILGPQISIHLRYAFYKRHPWTFMFMHWLIGTTFMFQFAVYIGMVRQIVRPGVLWFIRDPNDPTFNAMQEIFKRPFLTQIKKLVIGLFLYSTIIVMVIGGSVGLISQMDKFLAPSKSIFRIWPLRWEFHDSLTEFPIDLMLYHFVLPLAIRSLSPRKLLRRFAEEWFAFIAKRLRITAFLLGGEYPDEQNPSEDEGRQTHLRVPNHDHIEVIPGSKMLIPMYEHEPVFGRDTETPEEVRSNWTKVYVPKNFRTKIYLLYVFQWITAVFLISTCICAPLIIGRAFFYGAKALLVTNLLIPKEYGFKPYISTARTDLPLHDFYSFLLGLLIAAVIIIPVKFIISLFQYKLPRRPSIRRSGSRIHPAGGMVGAVQDHNSPIGKMGVLNRIQIWWIRKGWYNLMYTLKAIYLGFFGCIILPMLLGIVIDMFIFMALIPNPNTSGIVYIFQDWAMGCITLKVCYKLLALLPENRINQTLEQTFRVGIARCDLYKISTTVIFPLIAFFVFLLSLPVALLTIEQFLDFPEGTLKDILMHKGPVFAASLIFTYYFGSSVYRMISTWERQIRDEQFLVGQRLHNVEQ